MWAVYVLAAVTVAVLALMGVLRAWAAGYREGRADEAATFAAPVIAEAERIAKEAAERGNR